MNAPPPLLVACLCAEWCGSCRSYRALFDSVAAQFAGLADFRWIDIEDHADALGELDIETFPTLLIAEGDAMRFFGALTPQAAVLTRTLQNALQAALPPVVVDAGLGDLPARIRKI